MQSRSGTSPLSQNDLKTSERLGGWGDEEVLVRDRLVLKEEASIRASLDLPIGGVRIIQDEDLIIRDSGDSASK